MTQIYYKWLKPDRTTTYQGVKWPKRVGVWTPDATPVIVHIGLAPRHTPGHQQSTLEPVRCCGSPRDAASPSLPLTRWRSVLRGS